MKYKYKYFNIKNLKYNIYFKQTKNNPVFDILHYQEEYVFLGLKAAATPHFKKKNLFKKN